MSTLAFDLPCAVGDQVFIVGITNEDEVIPATIDSVTIRVDQSPKNYDVVYSAVNEDRPLNCSFTDTDLYDWVFTDFKAAMDAAERNQNNNKGE